MGRIKIEDLPKDVEISNEEMKRILGGVYIVFRPQRIYDWLAAKFASSTMDGGAS